MVDDKGTIYLVAEQLQGAGTTATSQFQLVVLTAPVPELGAYAMMPAWLGLLAGYARCNSRKAV